ncbi:hypothetical protein TBLA_0G02970 [Henningerozyma blattae CBS 6284]|uniref:ATP synthase subunit gamma n=1 Tax=Henningerozyma blattae (strain ATCC 34711 / CBS 6284 / DSM 70876 / NBRC 10599 / NRRL Y-10934 / UCD 77-7) TaxID=1071380 RepID=I2H782_HENB6|nr:hypothetical protein TBLA_0G02970 [Tetrapisispora blattae CBS 6284]CCH62234.1 hypothetical protein TBLA_0G02970 [Tetrapisispora blattae CBS 6284]
MNALKLNSTRLAANMATKTCFNGMNSVRTYVTLKEVETRLKSIKNIEKITKTMKIVASTRLNKAERAKLITKNYMDTHNQFYKNAGVEGATESAEPQGNKNFLIIAISSDKGLCGSIHSHLSKSVKSAIWNDANRSSNNYDIIAIGDKIKALLLRAFPENVKLGISQVCKRVPTYQESSNIADLIISDYIGKNKYDKVLIYYNQPVSSLSFEPAQSEFFNENDIDNSPNFSKFEIDPNTQDISKDLIEYNLANKILVAMTQGYAAEISARRNAMDNASKNAQDMIQKNSILYNRTRQAVITNELVDIITGASTLD